MAARKVASRQNCTCRTGSVGKNGYMCGGADKASTTERAGAPTVADRLAREIKRLRVDAGLSQRELAAKICYSRQYVSMTEWEDSVLPSQPLIAAIDDALAAHGTLIALRAQARVGRKTEYHSDTADHQQLEKNPYVTNPISLATNRRNVRDRADQSPEDLVDVLGRIHMLRRTVDPDIIRQLRYRISGAIEQYETLDHTGLATGLAQQRVFVDELINECNHPKRRRELFEIAGKTAGLMGYITVGRGNFSLARAYCLEALQLGEYAEDRNLQAWVCGLQSFCE